jgi:hypothetical protein
VPEGVYIVAGHPAFSSSEHASNFCAQVWRVWPDRAVQVVEFWAPEGALYTFAWTLLHLCATYSGMMPAYLNYEVGFTGQQVLDELQRMDRYRYGLSLTARKTPDLQNIIGNIQHYLFRRVDSTRGSSRAFGTKMSSAYRPYLLNKMRDELERRHLVIRSERCIDELAMLRRGEEGDADKIGGGAGAAEERALVMAYSVECWLNAALPDLRDTVPTKEPDPQAPRHVGEMIVQGIFAQLNAGRG